MHPACRAGTTQCMHTSIIALPSIVCLQEPKEIRLFQEGQELKESSTLAEAKVENGDTLAMTYALPGVTPQNALCKSTIPLNDESSRAGCGRLILHGMWVSLGQGRTSGRKLTSPPMTTLESPDPSSGSVRELLSGITVRTSGGCSRCQ